MRFHGQEVSGLERAYESGATFNVQLRYAMSGFHGFILGCAGRWSGGEFRCAGASVTGPEGPGPVRPGESGFVPKWHRNSQIRVGSHQMMSGACREHTTSLKNRERISESQVMYRYLFVSDHRCCLNSSARFKFGYRSVGQGTTQDLRVPSRDHLFLLS